MPARTAAPPRFLRPFQKFAQAGALGSIALLMCTAAALLWANSPWAHSYELLWETPLSVAAGAGELRLSLREWINDGLMAAFFLLVGLEIKRELLVGELSSPRQAALPIVAAAGGMAVPALIYVACNAGGAGAQGWGIPMATDIAFALGVLQLAGPHVPLSLKVFLAALAIVDDLGAVLVIALFYTQRIEPYAFACAALAAAALLALNRRRVQDLGPYLLVGAMLWLFLLRSGVHATIGGIVLAMAIPTRTQSNAVEFSLRARRLLEEFDAAETGDLLVITSKGQQEALHELDNEASRVNAPLLRLEHALNRPVSFVVMPLFALANAGVPLEGLAGAAPQVAWGAGLGLLAGKPAGILGSSYLAVRAGIASLPAGVTWHELRAAAVLAGIGFTMSLFVTGLAFEDRRLLDSAKLGVLLASTLSGVIGYCLLRRRAQQPQI
ncbi:MAG TPA: Na+/H+ antiporter NhaA [Candidatus Limnocylindrales bacterium]|nr:Na+/H+ antiporter NhaA [Candidatus Limnocylindrales bacterium]